MEWPAVAQIGSPSSGENQGLFTRMAKFIKRKQPSNSPFGPRACGSWCQAKSECRKKIPPIGQLFSIRLTADSADDADGLRYSSLLSLKSAQSAVKKCLFL